MEYRINKKNKKEGEKTHLKESHDIMYQNSGIGRCLKLSFAQIDKSTSKIDKTKLYRFKLPF